MAAESNDLRKARVRVALATMTTLLTTDGKEKRSKKGEITGRYLQQYALGLVARFTEIITDNLGLNPPVEEQIQCLGAMEEMIKVCKLHVCIARPQMSACLLSALASDELRSASFSCWEAMLSNMGEGDLRAQIETTFFVIGRYYAEFDERTKTKARKLLEALFEKETRVLVDFAHKLPSLKHVQGLEYIEPELQKLRSTLQTLDKRDSFAIFGERLSHENPGVVERALVELLDFVADDQEFLQASAISEQPDPVVSALLRSLLDCSPCPNSLTAAP